MSWSQSEELRYVYQRIGFQCLSETLFEDAGNNLFAGDLDPRALIRYYPELRGGLFSESDTLNVHAKVAENMPRERSIDDISEYPLHVRIFFFLLFLCRCVLLVLIDPRPLTYFTPLARSRHRRN